MAKNGIIDDVSAGMPYDKIRENYKLKFIANICTIYAKREKYLAANANASASPLIKTLKSANWNFKGNFFPNTSFI